MSTSFRPWDVVHVDLGVDNWRSDLDDGRADRGRFVVFWLGDAPVGQLLIPDGRRPAEGMSTPEQVAQSVVLGVGHRLFGPRFRGRLPARRSMQGSTPALEDVPALLACRQPLAQLRLLAAPNAKPPDAAPDATPAVSVVVCTRNRPDSLRECLISLRAQRVRPLEVLVVDNDPRSGLTRPVVDEFSDVAYIAEARRGLSAARNAGVAEAKGEVVAFTDDDVRTHPGWVAATARVFLEPGIDACTGLILPEKLETPAQLAFQLNGEGWGYTPLVFGETFYQDTKRIGVPVWRIGAGANMAFRHRVFDAVGLFDERLGAGRAGCSEDSELWYRLLASGFTIRYDPSSVVFHTHRAEADELRDQMHAYMKGHVTALLVQHRNHGEIGNLYRLLVELPGYYGRKLVGRVVKSRRPSALPLLPQIRGWFAGLLYYIKHRNTNRWNEWV